MKDFEYLINVENLHKRFERNGLAVRLFNGLNFSLNEKDFIVIIGEGGTGKTTLVNILTGLEKPSEGVISVIGQDLSKIGDRKITRLRLEKMGLVLQTSTLISDLTVYENIQLPMLLKKIPFSEQKSRVKELLEFFGISKKSKFLPNEISAGERKKTEIARALILDPPILILDEPVSNLDSPTINTFIPFLKGLKHLRDRTVLLTTNNLKIAKMANKEIFLETPKIK
ncbi:MAG: ATP-binding cassette domain-containing protein [Candidatus Bathyarchaeota archaeon]|jgi:putative ABC transport system ATP-binding protein|nr:ATP-binding cassette domain-containing protein [Candidatus Bathyarchaeota archaeon]